MTTHENTVRSAWNIACPDCGEDENLKVAIRTWAWLMPEGTEEEGDHEWDADSHLMCRCGWEGKVADAHLDGPQTFDEEQNARELTEITPKVEISETATIGGNPNMVLEPPQMAAGKREGVPGTPAPKTSDSDTPAKAEPALRRFYVTMTWDDWPEGGSYGTIVEARDHEEAELKCRLEMCASRMDGYDDLPAHLIENPIDAEILAWVGENIVDPDEWETVDCWDLDEFIANHARPGPFDAKHPDAPGSTSALDLIRGEGGAS